jgi:hypothetical protein
MRRVTEILRGNMLQNSCVKTSFEISTNIIVSDNDADLFNWCWNKNRIGAFNTSLDNIAILL